MGFNRNGARSFLDVVSKACKLSRLPGFRGGLDRILGTTHATQVISLWEPFCVYVDFLISLDDVYNRKDHTDEVDGNASEDGAAG